MEDKKVIWFIDKDAAPTKFYATQKRTTQFAQYFRDKGFDVKVFCSSFVHNRDLELIEDGSTFKEYESDGITYVLVRTGQRSYSFYNRVIAYIKFSLIIQGALKNYTKPDIIVHNSKTPFDYLVSRIRKKTGSKYIVDIADLWPNEFVSYGILKEGNPLLFILRYLEKKLYAKADQITFSIKGGSDYIKSRKWDLKSGGPINIDKVHYINTGISLKEFENNLQSEKIESKELDSNCFKVVYLGSIRKVNNLKQLMDAAAVLLYRKDIVFIIYGDGDEREELENYCQIHGITNVIFKDKWIQPQFVPSVLSRASLNMLNYSPNFGKWGWSMNKMFYSLASGKPMICNANLDYSIINEENIGIDKIFSSAEEYADAIKKFADMSVIEYENICEKVLKIAKSFDSSILCAKMFDVCTN